MPIQDRNTEVKKYRKNPKEMQRGIREWPRKRDSRQCARFSGSLAEGP